LGRCKNEREPVLLGYLHGKLSTQTYPWEKTPRSCYQAVQAIDVVSRLPPGIAPRDLAKHLVCIGDLKDLLDAYVRSDTTEAWCQAVAAKSKDNEIPPPKQALDDLHCYLDYVPEDIGKKRKRKVKAPLTKKFEYALDFQRFQHEHPHPLAINIHTVSRQIVHSRFLNYDELNLTNRVILLHSEMMTGKTSNVIVKMLHSMPNARVIALTPKRLFAESLRGVLTGYGFEFAHYEDEGFFKTRPDRVIIEIESLWKLKQYNFQPYDFLLIDESETILTQMLSIDTHKHNLKNNWDVLLWLLENANKVLLADARMTKISVGSVQDHCNTRDIHYIKNTFTLPMHVNMYLDKKFMEKHIVDSIRKGESLYTFSGGKNNAYHLHDLTKTAFGDDKSVVYSSMNSHTKQVKAELRDVNELWKHKRAIHTTPSITVGTSFDVPDVIQNIYLFPFTVTAGPKDVAQASRRIRKPIKPILNCVITGPRKKVPTTYRDIKKLLQDKSKLTLIMEQERVHKDFVDDEEKLQLLHALIASPGEKSTLVKTGIRVIQERNLQLRNYSEEMTRIFLDMGHTISIVRGEANKKEGVPRSMVPEQQVFVDHKGSTGIMAHYEENEDSLVQKEKEETLTTDDHALLKMVHYINNFDSEQWPVLSYEYWLDYRYKLVKDKRLQMILHGTQEDAVDALDRSNRYQVAKAEGDQVEEHLGILHTATVPEFNRSSFYAFARPLFRLFDLLELRTFKTNSTMIKISAPEVEQSLRECRVLLGPSGWSCKDLPNNPTYRQLIRFLTVMMHSLIDGTFAVTSVKKHVVEGKVKTKDKKCKSRQSTRTKRENMMEYALQFEVPTKVKSAPYSAFDRVGHLAKLD